MNENPQGNITFQESGETHIYIKRQTNKYLSVSQSQLLAGPVDHPGRPWKEPDDWEYAYYQYDGKKAKYTGPYPFGSVYSQSGDWYYYSGLYWAVRVKDRGTGAVADGKWYQVFTPINWSWIGVYIKIVGTGGGSILKPGFAFYNLITSPNTWSFYEVSKDFYLTGHDSCYLINPGYNDDVKLSIDFFPKEQARGNYSSIILTINGGYFTHGLYRTYDDYPDKEKPKDIEAEKKKKSGPLQLLNPEKFILDPDLN